MNPKSNIIIPDYNPTISVTAKSAYDFVHSDIISPLSYDDIIGYFGSNKEALNYYKETLASGYSRSAAFLIDKIIKGSIAADGQKAVTSILLEDLSILSEDQIGTAVDLLVAKIAKPTSKKKILFSSAHWLTGGMERVMSNLFVELKNDYEIFLITPYDERKSYIDLPDFVTSIKIANDLFAKHFDSLILSYALLFNIDVVVGFINLFDKQLNLYKLCEGTKIKTVASNHEYYFYPYKSYPHYENVKKRLEAFEKCDAIIWENNFNAALCGMYVDNNYVIGNPNTFEVIQAESKPVNAKTILCVGRFNDYVKRVDRMLECFSKVLIKVPDAKLVLVGKYDNDVPFRPNDSTTVNDLINNLAIPSGSINFVGEVNNVQDYYAKAKVLMLTSNSEGFGMVINEAASFGVPSVCNYIPGIEDLIADGESGYVTEQDDISSMAKRISDILNDDGLQKKLGNNAKEKASSYDSKHIGDKWRYLISSLLEIEDKDSLHKKLNSELGYNIQNQPIFSKVLARELNEIFFMAIDETIKHRITNQTQLLLLKLTTLPNRLKANIEYEGLFSTGKKIVKRSFRIARMRLKI